MMFVVFIAIFLFSVIVPSRQVPNEVKLEKNGYEDVLVAIGSDVKPNDEIIKRIQNVFTEASRQLLKATRNRAFFASVNILMPETWPSKGNYEIPPSGATFESANIRVDTPNPVWGNNPYTRQLGGCGEPGEYIHFTPEYFLNEAKTRYELGSPAKALVHEWGHLRWGLFDEYAIDKDGDSHFYQIGNYINPVRCTEEVPGQPINRITFEDCVVDPATLQMEKDCRFYPDLEANTAKASLMYMQFIDSVEEFCDDGTLGDEKIIHDRLAPNKHNRMCGGRSAWEVMRQHQDFKDGNSPPNGNIKPTPRFRLLQKKSQMVVLLLDTSGSMLSPKEIPVTLMIQAARLYILDLIQPRTQVSIVTFATRVTVKLQLTEITDMASRQTMLLRLPRKSDINGATALGAGLLQAAEVLTDSWNNKTRAKGSKIIVISDGQQNQQPRAQDIMKNYIMPLEIVVDTIAYSGTADRYLTEMSTSTGGKSFFISANGSLSTALSEAITSIGTSDAVTRKTPVIVESSVMTVSPARPAQGDFIIDSSVGAETKMIYSYLTDTEVDVRVTSPSGAVFDKTSTNYTNHRNVKQIEINLPSAEVGEWKYSISSKAATDLMVQVVSKAKENTEGPIRVTPFLGNGGRTLNSQDTAQLKVFAVVTRDYAPVIGLKVLATIEGENKPKITVPLQDNGIGPDATRDDGIYSGMFTRHTLQNYDGRFNVKIDVNNPDDTGKVATSVGGSGTLTIPRNVTAKPAEVEYKNVGAIRRVASAGQITVKPPDNKGPIKDLIPPPPITDLRLIAVSLNDSMVTITWTAVGDDRSKPNATVLDLRICSSVEALNRTDTCPRVFLEKPKPAGEIERRKLDLKHLDKNTTYFLRIRTEDEAGNMAEFSNVIIVVLARPEKYGSGGTVRFVGDENDNKTSSSQGPDVTTIAMGSSSKGPDVTTTVIGSSSQGPDVTTIGMGSSGEGPDVTAIVIGSVFGVLGFIGLLAGIAAAAYAISKKKSLGSRGRVSAGSYDNGGYSA